MKLTNFAGLMKKQPTMMGGSGEGSFCACSGLFSARLEIFLLSWQSF
jgi:hypothetical protein